jgi:hypothetical protein
VSYLDNSSVSPLHSLVYLLNRLVTNTSLALQGFSLPSEKISVSHRANLRVCNKANYLQTLRSKLRYDYHRSAYRQATEYLRTIYFGCWEGSICIPEDIPRVSDAERRNAMNKVDEINGRLMDRNISGERDIGLGLVHCQELIDKWKMIITTLDPRLQAKGDEQTRECMTALSDVCNERQYPRGWTKLPPSDEEL